MAVALAATPIVRASALRFGVLDHALSSRKVHGRPVPRLGGFAIVAAFYAPLVGLLFLDTGTGRLFWSQPQRALALILGGLAMLALGSVDDLRGAGARSKLTVEALIAVAMWWAGYRIDAIANPFGTLGLGVFALPFTVLWIVGVTNALNLIDGLDGLAAGIGLLAASAIFWVAFRNHRPLMMLFMACLGGALLGFLRYNFNPATIFMGDSGSLFVGFVLASTALETHEKSTTTVALLVPLVALSVPIGDTLLAMTRRTLRGQPVFSSDRGHIHHRLMDRGLSHRATVLALYGLSTVVSFVAVGLVRADVEQTVAYFGALFTIGVMLLAGAGYVRFDHARKVLSDRKNNLAMRSAVRTAGERIRRADRVEEVWEASREAAVELGACCASLVVVTRNGTSHRSEFSWGFEDTPSGVVRGRYSLLGERPDEGHVELGFLDGRASIDRDTEIAIEMLCEHVHDAVERISARRHAEQSGDGSVVSLRRRG